FGREFAGEPVPAFAAAARLCVELGLWANVEIKPARGHERDTGRAAARLCAETWPTAGAPLVSSFGPEAIEAAREAAPGLERGFLCERVPGDWRGLLERYGCVSLNCDQRHLTEAQARAVRDGGYWLLCYTVNDVETARRLFRWGVNA